MSIPPAVSKYMATLGAKGGAVKSAAKTEANRLNAQKPRKRKKKSNGIH